MRKWFSTNQYLLLDIIILLAFAVIPFWRMGLSGIADKTDVDFPLMPINNLYSQMFVWYDKVTMGYDVSTAFLSQIPFYIFLAILKSIGIALPIIQRIWFVLGFFIAGLNFYLLAKKVLKDNYRIPALFGSAFFIFNPMMMHLLSQGEHIAIFTYAFIPLTLLLAIKGLEESKLYYAIVIAWFSIIMAITNTPTLVIDLAPLFFYLLYSFSNKNANKSFIFKFGLFTLLSIIIANIWWILPGFLSLNSSNQMADLNSMWIINWKTISSASSYLNVVNLIGVPGSIHGPIIAITMTTGTIIIYSTYFFVTQELEKNKKHYLIFSLFLLFISFLFCLGDQTLFGKGLRFFMLKFPVLQMFRNPYKFGVWSAFSYSILISIVIYFIINKIKYKITQSILFLFAVFIIISNWPIFTGNLKGDLTPINIPSEYYQMADWLNQNASKEDRVLILPQEEWLTKYNWTSYDLPDFSRYLFKQQIIRDYPENRLAFRDSVNIMTISYDLINHNLTDNFSHYLYLMGTKYILLHHDIESYKRTVMNSNELKNNLSYQSNIQFKKRLGDLSLYQNNLSSDLFYATNYISNIAIKLDPNKIDINKLTNELSKLDINNKPVVFFEGNRGYQDPKLETLDSEYPYLSYKKINPTKYLIDVKNAKGPYLLVFQESFQRNWIARIEGENLPNHYESNGNSNSWLIDKKGNYIVTIEYKQQKRFEYLVFVEFIFIITSAYYVTKNAKKTIQR